MDIDDEDAFLYGDSEPIDTKPSTGPGGAVNDVVKTEEAKQNDQCESLLSCSRYVLLSGGLTIPS
jgi:hypothetical protein